MPVAIGRRVAPQSITERNLSLRDLEYGKHNFRVIEGGDETCQIMWPTMAWDDSTGQMESTWRSVRIASDSICIIDKIMSLESEARRQLINEGHRNIGRSVIFRTTSWLFLVFYRDEDKKHEPQILECSSSVIAKELNGLGASRTVTEGISVWENGPYFLYDVVIQKSKGTRFPTDYGVRTARNEWYGKCKVAEWAEGMAPPNFDYIEQGVFTQEEMDNLGKTTLDLRNVKVMSDQEILSLLLEYPINLEAVNDRGAELFHPQVGRRLLNLATEAGYANFSGLQGENTGQPALPAATSDAEPPTPAAAPPGAGGNAPPVDEKQQILPLDSAEILTAVKEMPGSSAIINSIEVMAKNMAIDFGQAMLALARDLGVKVPILTTAEQARQVIRNIEKAQADSDLPF